MLQNRLSLFTLLGLFFSINLFAYPTISQTVKEKKIYPMGKKIYEKRCTHQDLTHFKSYDLLLSTITSKKVCGTLSEKYAEALSLYIWDVKRIHKKTYPKLTVTKEDKCPVCGMYLHYYPTWVSRINYPKGESYSFDGIKDMMKFYFNNKEGIVDILVQDYYTLKTIDARSAFFVLGSDVFGPMGNELIAFENEKSAKTFSLEHKGKKIMTFSQITPKLVHNLD